MKTIPDNSIFSPEFQAILAPYQQEEIELLQQEANDWKEKYHHLLGIRSVKYGLNYLLWIKSIR